MEFSGRTIIHLEPDFNCCYTFSVPGTPHSAAFSEHVRACDPRGDSMRMSFIALNRILEERAASDKKYREQLERSGKVTLSLARQMPDQQILEKLRSTDIDLDKATLAEWCGGVMSAEDLSEQVRHKAHVRPKGMDDDWLWIGLTVLWERWLPQQPNFEMLDDKMQAGYDVVKKDGLEACEIWLGAWKDILTLMDWHNVKSLGKLDEKLAGTQTISNWIQDLVESLGDAGVKEPRFLHNRIAVCEETFRRWRDMDWLMKENFRRDLARTHFRLGDVEKANTLFQGWLNDDPRWGWGWIGWSDCYHLTKDESRDLGEAERILKQGLDVPGVGDRKYMLARLARLYKETGRNEEAADAQAQIEGLNAPEADVVPDLDVRQVENTLQIRNKTTFGGDGILLDQLENGTDWLKEPSDVGPMKMPVVGRNDPCPCGSGKKFKKCCGR
jgi:hypothetical protein